MAVQVTLLNQFLITLVPKDVINSINFVFKNFSEQPIPVMYEGFKNIEFFIRDQNAHVSGAAINGIMLGIMMASISEHSEQNQIFKDCIEQYSRINGDHVVDFSQFKLKRGK